MLELKVETVLRVFVPSDEQLKLFPVFIPWTCYSFYSGQTCTPVPKKKKIDNCLQRTSSLNCLTVNEKLQLQLCFSFLGEVFVISAVLCYKGTLHFETYQLGNSNATVAWSCKIFMCVCKLYRFFRNIQIPKNCTCDSDVTGR